MSDLLLQLIYIFRKSMEKLLLMVMSEAIYLRENSGLLGQVWWYGWRYGEFLPPLVA